MKKRGLTPVVATALLISLGLVLAVIIFILARSFVAEKTQKFDEPVEFACERVQFESEVYSDGTLTGSMIDVVNQGDVPLYGVEIRKIGLGSIVSVAAFQNSLSGGSGTIKSGESKIDLPLTLPGSDPLLVGDKVKVVPLILGQNDETKVVYTCDVQYGQEVTVQAL